MLEGCCKIGLSADPNSRLAQFSSPVELRLIHSIPTANPGWLESYLHTAFRDRHARAEWFRLDESDVALVSSIPAAEQEADLPPGLVALHERHAQNDRPSKADPEKVRVRVGVPPDEHLKLRALAGASGMSMSAYCETLILDAIRTRRMVTQENGSQG